MADVATQAAALVDELAAARYRQHVTQAGLAGPAGVTSAAIGGWEAHRDLPSAPSLARWAHALGLSVAVVDEASGARLAVGLAPRADETPEAYWVRCTAAILREARRGAGLMQSEVAQSAGVTAWAVAAWEAGRRTPLLPALLEWCAAVGCRIEVRGG